ncbi:MAG: hypothetical protein ABI311_14615, partial [Gemmatimonadaceae bacterium]
STATMSLGVAALMLNTACYSYNARPISDLHEGDVVSVAITPSGRQLLSQNVGDSVAAVRGKYVSNDAAGVHVNLTDAQFLSGISAPRDGINVTLPRAAYDSVSTRKLAVASTVWVVVGVVAGIAILATGININGNGTSKPTPPPPPPVGN